MPEFPKLYSKDAKGKTLVWQIEVTPNPDLTYSIISRSGELNGVLSATSVTVSKGKNIGKANQTSVFQQAVSDATSKFEKKKQKGYIEDVNALPEVKTLGSGTVAPMLARNYFKDDMTPHVKFPCLGQPKLNGLRCMVFLNQNQITFRTRSGLIVPESTIGHIKSAFEFKDFDYTDKNAIAHKLVFDGELYIHNTILSEITSAAEKPNLQSSLLEYRIYDLAIEDFTQDERIYLLAKLDATLRQTHRVTNHIRIVPTFKINNHEEAKAHVDGWIASGFEGGIFRDNFAYYRFGVRAMHKFKKRKSAEFQILDVVPMDKTPDLGMFLCKNDINNETFTVNAEGSHDKRREYLRNKHLYIGKPLTVEFYERTKAPKEVPFHAVGVNVRTFD